MILEFQLQRKIEKKQTIRCAANWRKKLSDSWREWLIEFFLG